MATWHYTKLSRPGQTAFALRSRAGLHGNAELLLPRRTTDI